MTTVVIVTYDSAPWIERCLEALSGLTVVVVDNASRDDTVDRVRATFPDVRVIERATNAGFARAVNEAARRAADDDLLIINPDVIAAPGSVAVLEAYLVAHPSVGIAVPRLLYPDGRVQESVRTFPSPLAMLARRTPFGRTAPGARILGHYLLEDREPGHSGPVPWAIGAVMLVRRDALAAVGPLDERFFLYGEDVDWCHRMWSHEWEVHLVAEATMVHVYQRDSRRTVDVRSAAVRHHWVSLVKLFAKHPGLLIGRGPAR